MNILSDENYTTYKVNEIYEKLRESDENNRIISIHGIAGTGKTYTMNRLYKKCIENGIYPAVSAPTNKAVSVIKAGLIINRPSTHHRLLGMTQTYDEKGKVVFINRKSATELENTLRSRMCLMEKHNQKEGHADICVPTGHNGCNIEDLLDLLKRLEQNLVENTLSYIKTSNLQNSNIQKDAVKKYNLIKDKTTKFLTINTKSRYNKLSLRQIRNRLKKVVVFIDEASMAGKDIYNCYSKIPHIRILLFGDRTQLKPVQSNDLSPFYSNHENCPEVCLTRHFRCSNETFNDIISSLSRSIDKEILIDYLSIYTPSVITRIWTSDVLRIFKTFPKDDVSCQEPLSIILCFTNRTVENLIWEIRFDKYGDQMLPIHPNEILVVDKYFALYSYSKAMDNMSKYKDRFEKKCHERAKADNSTFEIAQRQICSEMGVDDWKTATYLYCLEQTKMPFRVQTFIKSTNVEQVTIYDEYTNNSFAVYRFNVKGYTDYNISIIADCDEDKFKHAYKKKYDETKRIAIEIKTPNTLNSDLNKAETGGKINLLWKKYYQNKYSINAPVKHTYASTIHKAQGSSYDNVIVYNDFHYLKQKDIDTYNRLLYVGVSRTSKFCYVATNQPL